MQKRGIASAQEETIQFYDNYIPSLEAGFYTITVEQEIADLETNGYFQPVTQEFEVRGPQFTLEAQEIHALYPPDGSSGSYGDILPHVVLNKRVLPWERLLLASDQTIPWLALLAFQEDEIIPETTSTQSSANGISTLNLLGTRTSSVSALLQADPNVLKPAIDSKKLSQEVLSSQCQSIVISAAVFQAVVPRLPELKYLAHCRQVNGVNQESQDTPDADWFSVLISNSFPASQRSGTGEGARTIMHLVSLEGFSPYLGDSPTFPRKQKSSAFQDIQLVSLASWSFVSSQSSGASFAELLHNFVEQQGSNAHNLLLKPPFVNSPKKKLSSLADQATQRLEYGYVPLSYLTEVGEQTFSWYRGPFTPVVPQKLPATSEHFTSAAETMIYLEKQGIFDLSYTAAWEIGRTLALSDQVFTMALLTFRQRSYQLITTLLERERSSYLDQAQDLDQLLGNQLIRKKFDRLIDQDLSKQLTKGLSSLNAGMVAGSLPGTRGGRRKSRSGFGLNRDQKRISPVLMVQDFLGQAKVQAVVEQQMQEDLLPITQWLARLNLLYNVPFNHLVPDQRMLPVESLRFFYVDQGWLDILTDGALSIGLESSRDVFFQPIIKQMIGKTINREVQAVRAKINKQAVAAQGADLPDEMKSGILIRSALISDWPGLVIQGFQDGQPLLPLRMERLSSDVLLCIFPGIATTLQISEPPQGLSFGVEDNSVIQLRSLTAPVGEPLGRTFPDGKGGFSQFLRPSTNGIGERVLNINMGGNNVVAALSQALNVSHLGAADLAVEMVRAPEVQVFMKTH